QTSESSCCWAATAGRDCLWPHATTSRGKRTATTPICPPDLEGEPIRPASNQSQRRPRYRAIHARNGGRSWPLISFLARRWYSAITELLCGPPNGIWKLRPGGDYLQRRRRASARLDFRKSIAS